MDQFLEQIIDGISLPLDDNRMGLIGAQPFQHGYDFPETQTQFHFHGPDQDHLTYGKLVDYDRNLLFEEKSSVNLAMDDYHMSQAGFERFPVQSDVFVPMVAPINYAPKPLIDSPIIGGQPLNVGYQAEPFFVPRFDEPFRPILAPDYDAPSIDFCVAPVEHYAHTSYEPILPQGYGDSQQAIFYGAGSVLPRQDLETMVNLYQAEISLAVEEVRDSGYGNDFGSVQSYQPEPEISFGMSYEQEPLPEQYLQAVQPVYEPITLQPAQDDYAQFDARIGFEPVVLVIEPNPWETPVPDMSACGMMWTGMDGMNDGF